VEIFWEGGFSKSGLENAWVCIWGGNFGGGVFVFLRLENFFAGVFCIFRGGIAFLVESLQFFYNMI